MIKSKVLACALAFFFAGPFLEKATAHDVTPRCCLTQREADWQERDRYEEYRLGNLLLSGDRAVRDSAMDQLNKLYKRQDATRLRRWRWDESAQKWKATR